MPGTFISDDQPQPVKKAKPVAVFYGASSRHTRTIAERIATDLLACGVPVQMHNVWGLEPCNLDLCAGAMIVAPVHMGSHELAMVNFVKVHRAELEHLPVAFIGATLGESASPESRDNPYDPQPSGDAGQLNGHVQSGPAQFDGDVQMVSNPFFAETGWQPSRISSFSGVISYTRYNVFVRWMLKILAPKIGPGDGPGARFDVERKELGWDALDVFVEEFVRGSCAAASPAPGPAAAFAA